MGPEHRGMYIWLSTASYSLKVSFSSYLKQNKWVAHKIFSRKTNSNLSTISWPSFTSLVCLFVITFFSSKTIWLGKTRDSFFVKSNDQAKDLWRIGRNTPNYYFPLMGYSDLPNNHAASFILFQNFRYLHTYLVLFGSYEYILHKYINPLLFYIHFRPFLQMSLIKLTV